MKHPSPQAATSSPVRLPFTYFAIPFGVSGIAGSWSISAAALGVPHAVGLTLWVVAALAWLAVLAVYALRARGAAGSVRGDLRDPYRGPFGALVPVVAILVGGALARDWHAGATVIVAAGMIGITVISAWMMSGWMSGAIPAATFHPGFYLSVLAGGLIGAIGLAEVGARTLALAAFGVGVFFWAVLAAVVLARLVEPPGLPAALTPTLAIFSVPPSVAGIAWFAINGNTIDWVHQVLLALTVFLLLGQVFLIPRYRRVPFGIGYWSFTFSAAAPATYGIHWLWIVQPWGWVAWSWLILAAVTLWIGGIAAVSAWRGATAGGAGGGRAATRGGVPANRALRSAPAGDLQSS